MTTKKCLQNSCKVIIFTVLVQKKIFFSLCSPCSQITMLNYPLCEGIRRGDIRVLRLEKGKWCPYCDITSLWIWSHSLYFVLCKDITKRQQLAHQRDLIINSIMIWASSFQNCNKIHLYHLKHKVYGMLLWHHELRQHVSLPNTGGDWYQDCLHVDGY